MSHFRGQYQLDLVSGIECEAKKNDVNVIAFSGRCIRSPLPDDVHQNIIFDIILPEYLDGFIITSLLAHYATMEQMEEFTLRFAGVPVVTVNYTISGFPAFCADNEFGFRSLLVHLIEAHEYKRMAFVGGPPMNSDAADRFTSFDATIADYGIKRNPALIVEGDYSYDSGRRAVNTLFDERGIAVRDIDAIVAANDLMALGAIDGLKGRGVRVPDDVAVTGFDDILDASTSTPSLTTVRQPAFEIGSRALRLLCEQGRSVETIRLETTLVTRNSCGCSTDKLSENHDRAQSAGARKGVFIPGLQNDDSRLESGNKQISEFYIYELVYASDALRESQSLAELGEWIRKSLPALGIAGAYLFLYASTTRSTAEYELVSGYNEKGEVKKYGKAANDFRTIVARLLPAVGRYSYCALPLVFGKEQFGFIMLQVNPKAWIAYESIRSQISSCLKSIFLLEELGIANKALEGLNSELREADEQKTRFFINMTHETKTPLTLVKNYLEKYIRGHRSDPDILIVKQNIDRLLLNMINFLDTKKLEQGMEIYDHDQVSDLSGLIEDKIVLFREISDRKEMTITTNILPGVFISADPWAIDRILNNLLDNAIKYGRMKGIINVELRLEGETIFLYVEDDGEGIDPEKIEHIGKPYHQLSHEKSGMQGIGMGLYIVSKILETLGGELRVESGKGKGARFTIVLRNRVSGKDDRGRAENYVVSAVPDTTPAQVHIKEYEISPDKHSIFVVDDNAAMLAFLYASLVEKYNVFHASGAREALSKLETIPVPEAIISDVMMDGIDGHAFLDALSRDDRYNGVPFIFLTAKHDEADKLAGLARGAIDYIEKPFSVEELSNKIGSLIAFTKKQREAEASRIKNDIVSLLSGENNPVPIHDFYNVEKKCMEYKLSIREREVVRLMLKGLVNKKIASDLNIALRTVEFHIINIYKKLAIKDRYELFALFQKK